MNTDKLYYTDGRDVTVTATILKAHNKVYRLAGIIRHNLSTLGAPKAPGLLLIILGAVIGFLGLFAFLPVGLIPSVEVGGRLATINDYAIILGLLLVIGGLIALLAMKRRYAVRITTATEEANVVVSNDREYIEQIVDGLDQAIVERTADL